MNSIDDFSAIAALDLTPIKVKLMHLPSGEGWSATRAGAVEREYRRFLHLMKLFPHEQTAPLVDVDTFWHYHILDTMKYAADCDQVFGYFLHHYPYLGMRGDDDEGVQRRSAERMGVLYEQTFGESYANAGAGVEAGFCGVTSAQPVFCGAASPKAAFCGAAMPKSAFCGATSAKAAFCGAAMPKSAFCGVPSAKTAFCGAASAQSEFSGATPTQSAFCGAAVSHQ
jgi:hypothetical protein